MTWVSLAQLDERERGFSYKQDAKLDMRMNEEASSTVMMWSIPILTTICAHFQVW